MLFEQVEVTDQSITQATTYQVSKPKTPHVDGGKGGQNYDIPTSY